MPSGASGAGLFTRGLTADAPTAEPWDGAEDPTFRLHVLDGKGEVESGRPPGAKGIRQFARPGAPADGHSAGVVGLLACRRYRANPRTFTEITASTARQGPWPRSGTPDAVPQSSQRRVPWPHTAERTAYVSR